MGVKPDNRKVQEENCQAGKPRYRHVLVITGDYAKVGSEIEAIKIYRQKSNRGNGQNRLGAVMGTDEG